jgi:hypothetical protein
MIVKGPGADVYVMAGGLKRHLPDLATLDARRLRWSDINPLTSSEISWIPTGNRLLSALTQGSLVKGPGPEVFVVDNGARRHILNEGVLATCGYGASQIYHLSSGTLQSVPSGAALGGSPCPKFVPASGQLLKGSGPQVYLVQEGIKRHIPNEATFSARGYRFGNVDTVDDRYVASLPIGHSVVDVLAQGNLLQGTGPSVYVMHEGTKRHILSEGAFNACGYRWDAVQRIAGGPLAGIPTGAPLAGAPCPGISLPTRTLLKGFGPEVYVIHDGRKRHITSQDAFGACGYHWGNIDYVQDGVIASIPSSSPLASAPCP